MKHILALFAVIVISGCTHVSISDPSLLNDLTVKTPIPKEDLKPIMLNVDADMSCTSSQSGNLIRTSCSNANRLHMLSKVFNERGLNAYVSKDETKGPKITLEHDEFNKFFRLITELFNYASLGLLPRYDYDEYTVSYTDAEKAINVSESVKISLTKSWISLFIPNEKGLEGYQMRSIAEKNLVHRVLEHSNVGK